MKIHFTLWTLALSSFLSTCALRADDLEAQAEPTSAPGVVIKSPNQGLGKSAPVEVRFPTVMVPDSAVGQSVEAATILRIEPSLAGKFTWRSRYSGTFDASQMPALGTTFTVNLAADLRDAAGKSPTLPAAVTVAGPQLKVTRADPDWFSTADREPVITLCFNDAMDLSSVTESASFVDKTGKVKVPATVKAALKKELPSNPPLLGTYAEQWANGANFTKDQPVPSAVRIVPAQPLPPAEGWKFVLTAGATNQAKSATVIQPIVMKIGTITPMQFVEATGESPLDAPRELQIVFTKDLPNKIPTGTLKRLVSLEPQPEEMEWRVAGRSILITGNFEIKVPYQIKIAPGVVSQDGLKTSGASEVKVTFLPHEAGLALASFANTQWIGGKRHVGFQTANHDKVRVQIKRIDPGGIVYALRAYHSYENDPSNQGGYTRIPYPAMTGKTVWQKDFKSAEAIDTTEQFSFTWDEALGGQKPGVYFVDLQGQAKEDVPGGRVTGTQSLIQLTDIGLAWKFTESHATVFAFSHSTGAALKDIQIATFDDDANPLDNQTTNISGLATLNVAANSRWLVAVGNQDWHGIPFGRRMPHLNMWDFDVNYSGIGDSPSKVRDTLVFSDRPVYQPGDSVFFKAITRQHTPEGLSLHANKSGRLRAYDLNQQLFLEKMITVSDTGTYADVIKLPANGVGSYHIEIDFFKSPEQLKQEAEARAKRKLEQPEDESAEESDDAEASAGEEGTDEDSPAPDKDQPRIESSVSHYFLVQEYQPNAFKLAFDEGALKAEGETLQVPLKAAYFMGKALSDATAKWSSTLSQQNFSAEKFGDYEFCQARSYRVYDGEDWQEVDRELWHTPLTTGQGELKLSAKGTALVPAGVPKSFGVIGPKQLQVEAEITDLNQQTIAGTMTHTLHSSEFYVGVRKSQNAYYVNTEIPVEMVAVNHEGKRVPNPVPAKMLVERLVWNEVKVQTAGGGTDIRHDLTYEKVSETEITLAPEVSKEEVAKLKLAKAGTYNVTVNATDAAGAKVQTVVSFDLYGRSETEGAWAQREGIRIDLTADKDSYKAGDVAKVIVKSPFKGTALITVEREKVLKSWLVEVDGKGGAVEVPIDEAFAPNCFVSVLQVRGGTDDPRDFKQPDYRFGVCALTVESHQHDLIVTVQPEIPDVRPGAPVNVTTVVRDAAGKPVANAEVALWAADEGILSLVGYQMPEVAGVFHYAQPLRVTTGTSLDKLLPENPEERDYANKGFVVGGGGEDGANAEAMRKNFQALAFWNANLKTDAEGKVTVSFKAPDNLTQYRLQAIVNEGVTRFGSGESQFKVNKPLMLEPSLPRFANVGDEVMLKAVLHNTSTVAGDIEIKLTLDDHLELTSGGTTASKTLTLAAGQSKSTLFPVKFTQTGNAILKWAATGLDAAKDLKDSVQSELAVGTTEPLLRDLRFLNVGENGAGKNLLGTMSPELLDAPATIKLVLSNNRLVEGAEAIEQLLHYPYGCVEQTTSAMLPWLAIKDLRKAVPSLDKTDEEIAKVVQKGVDRLLSMQTRSGGLSYWPGGNDPMVWASAQGGMGLILASKAGANVPPARLASLLRYLSKSLRSERKDLQAFETMEQAFACYTLALGGKPEAAYHEVLFQKRAELSSSACALLALAITEAVGPPEMATTLLNDPAKAKPWLWLGSESEQAMRTLAWMKLNNQTKASAALEKLLDHRAPRGDWKNTFNNGWVVQALAAQARSQVPWDPNTPAVLAFNGKDQNVTFGPGPASQSLTFTTKGGGALPTLSIKVPTGLRLYGRVEISARATKNLDQGRAAGFALARTYQKVDTKGAPAANEPLRVGDLVLVNLAVDVPGDSEYLAIDDPLPATLEGVNPAFQTMAANPVPGATTRSWWSYDHQEMRRDRVLYFRNEFTGSGRFQLQYLARVIAEGKVTAPAGRIEAMYDPAQFGLSPATTLTTLAGDDDEVVTK